MILHLRTGQLHRKWSINEKNTIQYQNTHYYKEGEVITFPIKSEYNISLWRVDNNGVFLENLTKQIAKEKTTISIKGLKNGLYNLFLDETVVTFNVIKAEKWENESQLFEK